jgi:AsmA protein
MKFIKITLYSLLGLLLILIVAATYFMVTFDANNYKTLISEQVEQQTGRTLALGDIKPSVFPWLGVELMDVSLENAAGFSEPEMLAMQRLDVRIELLPLLRQQIKVDTLRLHGLQLNLQQDAQGVTNWDDILQKQSAAAADEPATAESAAEMPAALPALSVNGIELKDAHINWIDAATGQRVELRKLNLTSGAVALAEPVRVKFFTQLVVTEPAVSLDLSLSSVVKFDMQSQQLALDDTSMNVLADLSAFDLQQAKLAINTSLQGDLQKQQFTIPSLDLTLDASGDAIPGGSVSVQVITDLQFNLQQQTLRIKQLLADAMGVRIKSELQVTQLIDAPDAMGRVDVSSFNPQKLLQKLQIELPEMQGEQALQNVSLGFNLSAGLDSVTLRPLQLKLDQSTLNGFVQLENFSQPAIKYHLGLDQINLDNYLPPGAADESVPPPVPAGTTAASDIPIELPVEMLRTLNIRGEFNAQQINAFAQSLQQLHIETVAAGGLLDVPVISAKLLKGELDASAQLDVRGELPSYQFKMNAQGLQAESIVDPVLQDLLGKDTAGISGESNLTMALNTRGASVNALMQKLNGEVGLNAGEAILHGVDVEYFVRNVVADYLQQKKLPIKEGWRGVESPEPTTALKQLRANATIRNGVVSSKDLLLQASRFKVTGQGSADLPKQQLNYTTVVDLEPLERKTTAEKLLDIPVTVKVKGAFASPVISVDQTAWAKQAGDALTTEARAEAKAKLEALKAEQKAKAEALKQEQQEKAQQKVDEKKEELKDELEDKLKSLFR